MKAQRGLNSIFALPSLLPSPGLDRLQLQAPDPSGQRTRVSGKGVRDARAAPGRGPEHLLRLPGSSRTVGPRGSNPSVVRPRLPPAEPSESQELLSAQPPPSHSAQATWLRRVIFQNVDNVLRLLVPSAAHSRRPGSFTGPGLRSAPGEARDEAARSPSPAFLDHVSIQPEGASPGIIWTVFSVAVG